MYRLSAHLLKCAKQRPILRYNHTRTNVTLPTRTISSKVSINILSQRISILANEIQSHLNASEEAQTTLSESSPTTADTPSAPEYERLRALLNDAALDLLGLVNGPRNTLRALIFSHYDFAALQVALDRGFFRHVPLRDTTQIEEEVPTVTVAEIAERARMDVDRTGRIMKLLASQRIFEEVDGADQLTFRHNASSELLAKDAAFHATADMQMDDMLKATSETSTLVEQSPYKSNTLSSPFHQRFGVSMYQYLEENSAKAARFGQAMSSWSQLDRQIDELVDSFPWHSFKDGKIVDVGGGSGHISVALGRRFPRLQFIVQDISTKMLSQGKDNLGGRVSFQQHDFFTDQPVQGASAFLIRQCLHNYHDEEAVKILQAFIPALEEADSASPLLINDVVLPEANTVTKYEEHHLRQIDMCMMVALGAKQRTRQDWTDLLYAADKRLTVRNVFYNPLGVSLLEVYLEGGSNRS